MNNDSDVSRKNSSCSQLEWFVAVELKELLSLLDGPLWVRLGTDGKMHDLASVVWNGDKDINRPKEQRSDDKVVNGDDTTGVIFQKYHPPLAFSIFLLQLPDEFDQGLVNRGSADLPGLPMSVELEFLAMPADDGFVRQCDMLRQF